MNRTSGSGEVCQEISQNRQVSAFELLAYNLFNNPMKTGNSRSFRRAARAELRQMTSFLFGNSESQQTTFEEV